MCLEATGRYASHSCVAAIRSRRTRALSSAEFSSLESLPAAASDLSYDSLFASATEPVLILDASSGVVIEANPAVAALLQAERAALLGTPFVDSLEESSVAAVQRSFAIARAEGRAV